MKEGKKKSEDETTQKKERSFLDPFLKKLNIKEGTAIEEETAINIKNEALRSLKDRLLTRAEIIQRRLEEEQKNLENAYMELRRKGDNISSTDEQTYEKAVSKANFRMDILTERAQQHYKNSLDKFTQLDKQLMEEPMLAALKQPTNNQDGQWLILKIRIVKFLCRKLSQLIIIGLFKFRWLCKKDSYS